MAIAATTPDSRYGDEADLVRRAQARDPAAWSAWHDQYYGLIYRYAHARLRNQEDAEDVASQVFLEAMKSIHRYRNTGKPVLAWFYGIAHHMVSRRRRQQGRTTEIGDAAEVTEDGFEETAVRSVTLKKALDRLKTDHREVLVLRFLLELPTRRVAEILGKSEAATYSLQVRATEALRKALGER